MKKFKTMIIIELALILLTMITFASNVHAGEVDSKHNEPLREKVKVETDLNFIPKVNEVTKRPVKTDTTEVKPEIEEPDVSSSEVTIPRVNTTKTSGHSIKHDVVNVKNGVEKKVLKPVKKTITKNNVKHVKKHTIEHKNINKTNVENIVITNDANLLVRGVARSV